MLVSILKHRGVIALLISDRESNAAVTLYLNLFDGKHIKKQGKQKVSSIESEVQQSEDGILKEKSKQVIPSWHVSLPFICRWQSYFMILTAIKIRTLCDVAIGSKDQLHILNDALK